MQHINPRGPNGHHCSGVWGNKKSKASAPTIHSAAFLFLLPTNCHCSELVLCALLGARSFTLPSHGARLCKAQWCHQLSTLLEGSHDRFFQSQLVCPSPLPRAQRAKNQPSISLSPHSFATKSLANDNNPPCPLHSQSQILAHLGKKLKAKTL